MSCPNACGSKIARLMMEDHMLYTCKKRLVACQVTFLVKVEMTCIRNSFPSQSVPSRFDPCVRLDPNSPLSSQYCKRDFAGGAIDDHQAGCGFEPVHCDNKCGARIARNRLKAHRVNTCSKRLVRCQYCERSFTAETLQVKFPSLTKESHLL